MKSIVPLHQYVFKYDGSVIYRKCEMTKVFPDRHDGRTKIQYHPVGGGGTYYVYEEDVDRKVMASGTKTVVLTEPDFEQAKELMAVYLQEAIERTYETAASFSAQLERLPELQIGANWYVDEGSGCK